VAGGGGQRERGGLSVSLPRKVSDPGGSVGQIGRQAVTLWGISVPVCRAGEASGEMKALWRSGGAGGW